MGKLRFAALAAWVLSLSCLLAGSARAASAGDSLLVIAGVDSGGEKVTENYWNGFAVAGPDGQDYVLGSYYCYQDGASVSAAEFYAFNDAASAIATAEAADENGLFCLLRVEDGDGLSPIPMAEAAALAQGEAVTVVGLDWSGDFDMVAELVHSYDTTVTGSRESGGFALFSLADAAPNTGWESAMVLSDDGAVGMLLATDGMNEFFPMDYVLAYLGYETSGGTSGGEGSAPDPSGVTSGSAGGAAQIIFGIAIVLVAAALVFGIVSYRKKKAFFARELVEPLSAQVSAAPLSLSCTGGELAGMCVPLRSQVAIGRASACQLVYSAGAQGVSATHCIVRQSGDRAELTDLGSTCGTFVSGQRIAPNAPVSLAVGDSFYLGAPENSFTVIRQSAM